MTRSDLSFLELSEADCDELAGWLSSDVWPFHGNPCPTGDSVARLVDEGHFASVSVRTFWIADADGMRIGLVRLFDLEDENPLFDIWIRTESRGGGVGKAALGWLTSFLFTDYPRVTRISGNTREDNVAMRRVFRSCGYVKEAHYRRAWPTQDGRALASVGYAILREDWAEGKTTPVAWDDEPV